MIIRYDCFMSVFMHGHVYKMLRGGSRDSVDEGGAQLWSNIFNN